MFPVWLITICICGGVILTSVIIFSFSQKLKMWFFGKNKEKSTPAEIIKYVGLIGGGILAFLTFYTAFQNNLLTGKTIIQTKFNNATQQLSSDNTSANLTGVYTLYEIAKEASENKEQMSYVDLVHRIFCDYIREYSSIKPKIITQSIVDFLFAKENNIFQKQNLYPDLSGAYINGITFKNLNIVNADFSKSEIRSCAFRNTNVTGTSFISTQLKQNTFNKTIFDSIKLGNALIESCKIMSYDDGNGDKNHLVVLNSDFTNAKIKKTKLYDTRIANCIFKGVEMDDVLFVRIVFDSVYFKVKNVTMPTSLNNVIFDACKISNSVFENVIFNNVLFQDVEYRGYSAGNIARIATLSYSLEEKNVLDNVSLINTKFSNSLIKGVIFKNSNLQGAFFENTDFLIVDFIENNSLSNIKIENGSFRLCRFINQSLNGLHFNHCNFTFFNPLNQDNGGATIMSDEDFLISNKEDEMHNIFENTRLYEVNINNSSFIKFRFVNSNFDHCNLNQVQFRIGSFDSTFFFKKDDQLLTTFKGVSFVQTSFNNTFLLPNKPDIQMKGQIIFDNVSQKSYMDLLH